MSATGSNLSSPKYGYDLVCATTQRAINATMKRFLSAFNGTQFSACYVYDPQSKKTVEASLATITSQIGGDPFTIPHGATQANDMVSKLYNTCKFQFAFRAKMGISASTPVSAIPNIVILNMGNSMVSYQLFCAEFQVINLQTGYDISFSNLSQPAVKPWTFLFTVSLDFRAGEPNFFNSLPQSIQNQVKNINPNSMFSVQQLYLDLNTAGLQTAASIEGLERPSEAYIYLTKAFINQYWYAVNAGGKGCILGYVIRPTTPNLRTPSIIPTDLGIEISPHLDANGKPSGNFDLYTINYLVMSRGARMPPPVPFSWNWVEADEQADFHGVMSIRRDIFVDFLAELVNPGLAPLNYVTTCELTHDHNTYHILYYAQLTTIPIAFSKVAAPVADADGYTRALTLSVSRPQHDDSMQESHSTSIHGDFNYSISGDVAFKGPDIRIRLNVVLYVQFNIHELGVRWGKTDQNVVDYWINAHYQLTTTPDGRLIVVPRYDNKDNAPPFSWEGGGIVDTSGIRDYVRHFASEVLKPRLETAMQSYEKRIADMLNHSHAWVFPGSSTFSFKKAAFSDQLDLMAYITYADPT